MIHYQIQQLVKEVSGLAILDCETKSRACIVFHFRLVLVFGFIFFRERGEFLIRKYNFTAAALTIAAAAFLSDSPAMIHSQVARSHILKMVERKTIYAVLSFVICLLLIFSTKNEKTTEIKSFYHEPWRAGKNITANDFIYENDICDPISKFLKI